MQTTYVVTVSVEKRPNWLTDLRTLAFMLVPAVLIGLYAVAATS